MSNRRNNNSSIVIFPPEVRRVCAWAWLLRLCIAMAMVVVCLCYGTAMHLWLVLAKIVSKEVEFLSLYVGDMFALLYSRNGQYCGYSNYCYK